MTWKLPAIDLKLVGSDYKVTTTDFAVDFDGSPMPLITSTGKNEFQENNTAELQLVSNADSWGSDWLQYTAGLYYYKSKGGYYPVELSVANSIVTLPTGQVVGLIPQGLLDILGPIPFPAKAGALLTGLVGAESYSGYLQFTAKPTDWLGITLGGRYQKEQRTLIESTIAEPNIAGGRTTLLRYPKQDDNRHNLAPKASIDVHLSEDILAYVSYQKGFKSSTYNVVNVTSPPSFVKPETVTAYEAGIKTQLLDHTLTLNGAAFQNNVKDLQASFVSLFAGGLAKFLNVGAARVRGVEFDFQWVAMPDLNPGLVLTGAASILDPKYTDYTDADGYAEGTGFYTSGNNYTGNQIVRTAKFTGSLGISQTIDTSGGPVELGVDASHNSGFYFQPSNYEADHQPQYTLLNARVSYLYEPWNVRLTVFGANLTDKRYTISQFRTDFGRLDTLAPPITYGASINWDF